MLAKALARHSGMRFLCVQLSQILDKWVGESEKYVQAIFSLAQKLQPCVVFLDEVEALTRQRGAGEREWSGMVKSQLLALWGECEGQVVILGATNRREDIDDAFLRRMPLQLCIGLPDMETRHDIFKTVLRPAVLDWHVLAGETEGFSGSDIRECCRRAALECLEGERLEIALDDLLPAIYKVRDSKVMRYQ
jgi:adenosinetriphosphatase